MTVSPSEYTEKLKNISENLKKVKCLLCNENFISITHHLNKKHNGEYNKLPKEKLFNQCTFKCEICDKKFNTFNHLEIHVKVIHLDVFTKCEVCSKDIKTSYMYEHNINFHSENIYKSECKLCHLQFKHERLLKKHLTTDSHKFLEHQTNLPVSIQQVIIPITQSSPIPDKIKPYTCSYCNSMYSSSESLNRHINSQHTKKINFKCNVCEKMFLRKDHLDKHVNSVHNKEKVKCKYCDQEILKRDTYRHEPNCKIKISYYKFPGDSKYERFVSRILTENGVKFILHYRHVNLQNLPFDFYIPETNTIIEVHGQFHYQHSSYSNAEEVYDRTIKNDTVKKKFALENQINFIEIDTRIHGDYESISRLIFLV